MSMKVNVVYRGIIYRVRGIRILCSVITVVILLLLTLISLGVWMLISAYGEDKYIPSPNKSNLTSSSKEISNNSSQSSSIALTPSIDFNSPLSSSESFSNSITKKPEQITESNEVHEAIAHFQPVLPNNIETTRERYIAPDPSYGIFTTDLDELNNHNQQQPKDDSLTKLRNSEWEPFDQIPDSVVQYSDVREVYVVPSVSSDTLQSVQKIDEPGNIVEILPGKADTGLQPHFDELSDIDSEIDHRNGNPSSTEISKFLHKLQENIQISNSSENLYKNDVQNTPGIIITKPRQTPTWQTKMGAILGLPPHMMPKGTTTLKSFQNKQNQEVEETLTFDVSSKIGFSQSDDQKPNGFLSESESYSSFYPMKENAAYPDLNKYSSTVNDHIKGHNEDKSSHTSTNDPINIPLESYSNEDNIEEIKAPLQVPDNWYDHKVGLSEPGIPLPYDGPAVVGYGDNPYKKMAHDSAAMLGHFWDTYNSNGSVPKLHEDRGPVPEDTKFALVDYGTEKLNTGLNNPPPPSVRGSVPYAYLGEREPLLQRPIIRHRILDINDGHLNNVPGFQPKEHLSNNSNQHDHQNNVRFPNVSHVHQLDVQSSSNNHHSSEFSSLLDVVSPQQTSNLNVNPTIELNINPNPNNQLNYQLKHDSNSNSSHPRQNLQSNPDNNLTIQNIPVFSTPPTQINRLNHPTSSHNYKPNSTPPRRNIQPNTPSRQNNNMHRENNHMQIRRGQSRPTPKFQNPNVRPSSAPPRRIIIKDDLRNENINRRNGNRRPFTYTTTDISSIPFTTNNVRNPYNRLPLRNNQFRPQTPQNNIGPLQGMYDYSTRLANTLLNFPMEIASLMKNSTDEYFGNTIGLLQDYNKIFDDPDIDPKDSLSDKDGDKINRNERLMLPGLAHLKTMDPFEMSLVTWTFLDFWEFLIEKVGSLSSTDLNVLENRLDRLRVEKDNLMARSLMNATLYQLQVDRTFDYVFQLPGVSSMLQTLTTLILNKNNDTDIIEGRMFDPLGLFNSEQRVKFMQLAVRVLLKFGRVYLQKSYALDCMMLLFCKELNQHTKKDGLDGLSAKLKTVGLKVLTDREERETDTINDIWRAVSAYSPLQCDTMFPKCDGSKALEIVNDVASGSE